VQKWGGIAGDLVENYDVFMAVSQKSGKDNSGRYSFKSDSEGNYVDEGGTPITESGRPPAIDHDMDEIADAFIAWGKQQGFSFLVEC